MSRIIAALILMLGCTVAQAQTRPTTQDIRTSVVLPADTHWMIITANKDGTQSIVCDQQVKSVVPLQPANIIIGDGWIMVTWSGTTPPPEPVPTPGPEPTPVPVPTPAPDVPRIIGDIMVMTIIQEPPTPEQLAIINSTTLTAALEKFHAKWYPCTTKAPGIDLWLKDPKIKAVGTPVLAFITKNAAGVNSAVFAMKLPTTDTAIIDAVQRTRPPEGVK